MGGEHPLHDFGPFKCVEACYTAQRVVCPGECPVCTCVMSAKILGLTKTAVFQFSGRYLDKAAWEGKPLPVGDLPETEATIQKREQVGELPEKRGMVGRGLRV